MDSNPIISMKTHKPPLSLLAKKQLLPFTEIQINKVQNSCPLVLNRQVVKFAFVMVWLMTLGSAQEILPFFFLLMSFTYSESHLSFQKHSSITKCVSAHYILDSKQLFPHFSRFPCVLGTDLLHIPHQIYVPELNKQTRRREKEALGKTGLDHLLSGICKANVNFYSSRYCTLDHFTLGWMLGHNF